MREYPTYWTKDPMKLARYLLARDGLEHFEKIGEVPEGATFYGVYCHKPPCQDVKAFVIHWPGLYLSILGWGGGLLWFLMEDASVPDGAARELVSVPAADGGVDNARVVFSFAEIL